MVARNALLSAPPYQVETALKSLGENLRTARLRRNLSLKEVAEKIGVERHVISAAENGKPSTGIAVYAAMLWAFDLVDQLGDVAHPDRDEAGKILARRRERVKACVSRGLDDNF